VGWVLYYWNLGRESDFMWEGLLIREGSVGGMGYGGIWIRGVGVVRVWVKKFM
jgi:hypothetical protein